MVYQHLCQSSLLTSKVKRKKKTRQDKLKHFSSSPIFLPLYYTRLNVHRRTCVGTRSLQLDESDDEKMPYDAMLQGCDTLLLDGRHGCVATRFAREARKRGMHVVMDAETSDRPHFSDMLREATVIVTNATFPQAETKERDLLAAMASLMCDKASSASILITTRGAAGCLAMERCHNAALPSSAKVATEEELSALAAAAAAAASSPADCTTRLYEHKGTSWLVHLRKAIAIPPELIRDTTGAGDSFVGAVAYGVTKGFPLAKVLDLATYVSSCKCKGVGSHGGVPRISEVPKEYV